MTRAAEMLDWWMGRGGDAYVGRNVTTEAEVAARARSLGRVWDRPETSHLPPPATVLEVGCGPGANLRALLRAWRSIQLWALDPNPAARAAASAILGEGRVFDGHAAAIPAADASFDLVMTAGVLIHVPPEAVRGAMIEIARVAKRYVLAIEYAATQSEAVVYYGADRIWRDDYGRRYVELGLTPCAHGFFWRAADEGYDNTVWWLLQKPPGWQAP